MIISTYDFVLTQNVAFSLHIRNTKPNPMTDLLAQKLGFGGIFMTYASFNLLLALLSATMCLKIAPEAIGSGIPEVKAYLNGVRVKKFSSWKCLVVKIIGTILSVSSGLCIGIWNVPLCFHETNHRKNGSMLIFVTSLFSMN